MNKKLSILKNATDGCITYYVGDNVEHIKHLKNCSLICRNGFNPELEEVEIINVDNPQVEFYKLSHMIEGEYSFLDDSYIKGSNCEISIKAIIGDNVIIGPGTVIYSKTIIGNNVRIDANCTIGAEGMLWVWENNKKVFLNQLGGVRIDENCIIGSNTVIARGSANELTIIENDVNMSHGCLIGHGTIIGRFTHLANGVKTGGSSMINEYNFLGSGVIISSGIKLSSKDIIIGSGTTVTKDITDSGVYVGTPAKKIKESIGKLSGVPEWKNNS